MRRSISSFLIILLAVLPLCAQSTWEGITAVSRYGEFPESGNYGASNSFAMNTAVTVRNIENGRQTTVIITDRLEEPGLFLLVSKAAGSELGISQGEIARVSASIAQPEGTITAFPDDLPYNPDPDVNPAASIRPIPRPTEPIPTPEETEIAAVDEEEAAEEPEETAEEAAEEVEEIAEADADEAVEAGEPEKAVEEVEEIAETDAEEPVEIAEAPPRINGVDEAEEPVEEAAPVETADEPSPPFIDTPSVLGLNPAPMIDRAEEFVLLAEPDVPDASELVGEPEEEDLRISSLDEPDIDVVEEALGPIVPPEPVFEERLVEAPAPVAEDILIVSNLDEPDAVAIASYDVPRIGDEPTVPEMEKQTPQVLALDPAKAPAEDAPPEIADIPDVTEAAGAEEIELRYSLLGEPGEPAPSGEELAASHEPGYESAEITLLDSAEEEALESIAELGIDEPTFVPREEEPAPEDILIVSGLESPAEPGEPPVDVAAGDRDEPRIADVVPGEDSPIVVNGFAPPEPGEVEIVLEPAEPKPPEPRIADSDLLERAEGEEPEREVEVAAVTEPEVVTEREPEAAAEEERPSVVEAPREAEEETAAVAVEYTTELAKDDFYLQLAAFSEPRTAAKLKADLSETYPVTVYLTESPERRVYKVLVGPLSQDESGALLYRFRVRGFPDAFVRVGAVN